ncbi:Uncharacterized protein PECH_006643 [Penicillium ucsense]|uniref:DSC E3 ubiquitin ligase complex subunit A n=1 Tax=Penicillium ucsense TaxID=2839758 RepID=A0A8J8WJD1_9EURO|nr:Uncharacterized protein PECM_000289 [Penicillium ucsense]KAF7735440.1 Uncharacterized protein PECH_006643 [Penicillium ucsense]
MDNRGSFIVFLLVFYLLLSSQSRPPLIDEDRERQRALEREQNVLELLNGSKYGDFDPPAERWLPFLGARSNDSFAWDLLPHAQGRVRDQLQSALTAAGVETPRGVDDIPLSSSSNLTKLFLPVYRNVTGKLHGDWVRRSDVQRRLPLNVTAIALEHQYYNAEFSSNITGNDGSFYFDIEEGGGEDLRIGESLVREIRASLKVESNDFWGSSWDMPLSGVHFPENGGIVLTTTSEKFAGIFTLPHLTLSADTFEMSHKLSIKSLVSTMSRNQSLHPSFIPWSTLAGTEQVEFLAPKCEHVVFIQQHPVVIEGMVADRLMLDRMEQELRYPVGAPIPDPPLMIMSCVVFSPDCGYILESKGAPEFPPMDSLFLTGPKAEQYSKYSARLIFMTCGVFVGQIALLLRQIKEASTPSTRSRISFYTIALMALGDGLILAFMVLALSTAVSFLVLSTALFLAFLSVSYIGMKFMLEIWAVQEPERREERSANAPAPTTRPGTLPLPVTAPVQDTGATPVVILTPDQDPPADDLDPPAIPNRTVAPTPTQTRTDVGTMYARFYLVFFALFMVTSSATFLPRRAGSIFARVAAGIYLSFWVPQIHRNVMRNCRKALRWEFVIGQSILRLFPFLYFLTARENVLFIRPDWTTALVMVGWVWAQAWVLASQDVLGPRFFVPRGWAPPAYDYHPTLRDGSSIDEDLESGNVISITSLRADERDLIADTKDDGKHMSPNRKKVVFDCAICMQDIEIPVFSASASAGGSSVTEGASNILSRRTYMVTPCRHIFHTPCLESWMRLRLQCPICRESIPPV